LPGLIPHPTNTLEKSDQVDELRAAIGLPTLARKIEPSRTAKDASIDEVFRDRAGMDAWARSVGWRPKGPE
jgi:hypothetical protein